MLTNTLKPLLHRKIVEVLNPLPVSSGAGIFLAGDSSNILPTKDNVFLVAGASSIWQYSAANDIFMGLPASGITGIFGGGACGVFKTLSAPGGAIVNTARANGTTTTLLTSLTLSRDLRDHVVRLVDGSGAGHETTIKSNTVGTNATITFNTAAGVSTSTTTQFQIFGGSLWFFNSGAGTVGFSVYDKATNAWTARSVTNLPTTFGTEGVLVSGASADVVSTGAASGAATASSTTTVINDSTKTYPTNGWTNAQLRFTSGANKGVSRTIASNTATAITVGTAFPSTPATSDTYVIEGNDDYLYLLGNGAVTLYRYQISTNTWSTLSPTAARTGSAGAGVTASFIDGVKHATWTDGSYSAFSSGGALLRQNGRFIFSFRGGSTTNLDVYDIALNTWIAYTYGGAGETYGTGSSATVIDGNIYIQKDATGRIMRYDVSKSQLEPYCYSSLPNGTASSGSKMFTQRYVDTNEVQFLYSMLNTKFDLVRWVMI